MTELGPEDRVPQVASCQNTTTTTCGKLLTRQIDPNCKRAIRAHDLARAKAKANAAAAAAAEVDAEARLQIGKAKLKAEKKYITFSKSGSSWGDTNINFALVV